MKKSKPVARLRKNPIAAKGSKRCVTCILKFLKKPANRKSITSIAPSNNDKPMKCIISRAGQIQALDKIQLFIKKYKPFSKLELNFSINGNKYSWSNLAPPLEFSPKKSPKNKVEQKIM